MLEVIDRGRSTRRHPAPVVFVHGAWHGAWCWNEHFLGYFAERGYRALAVSLRGHGGSATSKPLHSLSIADYVDDLGAVAGSLPRSPVIVGHSMGGFVVQKYLESNAAPAAVLLAANPPRTTYRSLLRLAGRHPWLYAQSACTRGSLRTVGTAKLVREVFFSPSVPEDRVVEYAERLQEESHRAVLDMLFLDLRRPKGRTAPILVLGAEDDVVFAPREVHETARAYGTSPVFFPRMAHNMMLDVGWSGVARHIDGWLGRQGL